MGSLSRAKIEVQQIFVDREEPLSSLSKVLDSVRNLGKGLIITVYGEPGVGKTTLIDNFLNELESKQELVILRTAGRVFANSPYSALSEMFSSLKRSKRTIEQSKQIATIILNLAKLVPAFEPAISLVSDVASRVFSLTQADKEIIGNSMYVNNLFVSLFEKLSSKNTVVAFFDDLQWFDGSSLESLCFLLEKVSRMQCMIVLNIRKGHHSSEREEANIELLNAVLSRIDENNRLSVNLEPLSLYSSTELATVLAKDKLTKEEIRSLASRTGGNPYFINCSIKGLQTIRESDNSFAIDRRALLAPKSVSDPIQTLLLHIKREDLSMRVLLDYAAILGDRFKSKDLSELMNEDHLKLIHHLEELETVYGIMRNNKRDGSYEFDHSITREVILDSLKDAARGIHEKAAKMYEERGSNPELVAIHYDSADRPKLALKFYVEAAKNATTNFSFADSTNYWKRGLELANSQPGFTMADRTLLSLQLGLSQFSTGQFEESYTISHSIVQEIESGIEISKQLEADTRLLLGKSCRYIGTKRAASEGIPNLRMACQILEELDEKERLGASYSTLSTALDHFAFHEEALEYFGRAQKVFNEVNDRVGLATLGRKSGMFYDSRRTIDFLDSAIQTFKQLGATIEVARCLNNQGAERFYIGDFASSKKSLLESIKLYREIDSYEIDIPLNNLGLVYMQLGDFPSARSFLTEAFERSSEVFNRICSSINISVLDKKENTLAESLRRMQQLASLIEESGEPLVQDYFGFNMASILLSNGLAKTALEWLEKYQLNVWKDDNELALAKRLTLKARILKELGTQKAEVGEIVDQAREIFKTTRPQKWFYLIDYYLCDLHVLD